MKKIALLPGDGIGPEITREAVKILEFTSEKYGLGLEFTQALIGGAAIDECGVALPEETLRTCEEADAILLGAVGGPRWDELPPPQRPERAALLPLRAHFKLFANLRPSRVYPGLEALSPLKDELARGIDILCVRELTGGLYFGPQGLDENEAFDTERYSRAEILRIARLAFEEARKRRGHLTLIDKANVMKSSILWRQVVGELAREYEDVAFDAMYVDAAAMALVKSPSRFDVLLCSNLFGDILSDELAAITGSLGLLPSLSLNERGFGLYECAGGSAPDIAGRGVANPIAQILSAALLLKFSLGQEAAAGEIEAAVAGALREGKFTADLAPAGAQKILGTEEMGEAILEILRGSK